MWTPSPAVEWLESHPRSPYNLRHAELAQVHEVADSNWFDGPHTIIRAHGAFEAGAEFGLPMIRLKSIYD